MRPISSQVNNLVKMPSLAASEGKKGAAGDPATLQSSRVFVKGLPPSLTESDFRKHFSAGGRVVTDVKLIPQRRLGYVGFKSPEIAAEAVKYFNRTFIRMSRISVEIAKPVGRPCPVEQRTLQVIDPLAV